MSRGVPGDASVIILFIKMASELKVLHIHFWIVGRNNKHNM